MFSHSYKKAESICDIVHDKRPPIPVELYTPVIDIMKCILEWQSSLGLFYFFTAIKTEDELHHLWCRRLGVEFICLIRTYSVHIASVTFGMTLTVMIQRQCRSADPHWQFVGVRWLWCQVLLWMLLFEGLSLHSTKQPSQLFLTRLSACWPKHCLESAYLATQAGQTKRQISKSCLTSSLCDHNFSSVHYSWRSLQIQLRCAL